MGSWELEVGRISCLLLQIGPDIPTSGLLDLSIELTHRTDTSSARLNFRAGSRDARCEGSRNNHSGGPRLSAREAQNLKLVLLIAYCSLSCG